MVKITNNTVELTRGDSAIIPLSVFYSKPNLINISYFPNRYDKIYFSVMEANQSFENAIIKKIYTYDDINQQTGIIKVKFDSIDTQFLKPDTYYYTVKILKKGLDSNLEDSMGRIETVISNTKFVIKR